MFLISLISWLFTGSFSLTLSSILIVTAIILYRGFWRSRSPSRVDTQKFLFARGWSQTKPINSMKYFNSHLSNNSCRDLVCRRNISRVCWCDTDRLSGCKSVTSVSYHCPLNPGASVACLCLCVDKPTYFIALNVSVYACYNVYSVYMQADFNLIYFFFWKLFLLICISKCKICIFLYISTFCTFLWYTSSDESTLNNCR